MQPLDDVITRPAMAQSALLRDGSVSVAALTDAYLQRIARLDARYHAFVELRPEAAMAAARALDRERLRDPDAPRGALWGLPTAMKDLHLVRGTRTRLGSRAFRWMWTPVDDLTTAAVRRAGMVVLGKLSTSELAILPVVDVDIHPPTRNPWDDTRYSGGSSGGSSAAVASGMLPVAVASDGAGSIRIPAAFCGLVGHKPTRGLVPNPFARFETLSLSVVGPHARSVDDATALLDALCNVRTPARSLLRAARHPPRRLRVRVTTQNPMVATEPHVAAGVARVAATLAAMGHHVDTHNDDVFQGTLDEFLPMFQYMTAGMLVPGPESWLQGTTRWLREAGRRVRFEDAFAARELFRARVDAWFGDVDLWVTPTVAVLPATVGTWRHLPPEQAFRDMARYGAFTAVFNASGNPATSVPVWPSSGGMPVGVQLVGRRSDDARVLATARALLEALETPVVPIAPDAR